MGLITKEVRVKLTGSNIKWFKDLGYDIPTRLDKYNHPKVIINSEILVKVNYLKKYSHAEVTCECDECNKILNMPYESYYRYNRNGKIYCISCARKIFNTGKNSPLWNSNKTEEERINKRKYPEYNNFIKKVLIRDNYTCQCCGKYSEHDLIAHHLDGYDWCIERRTDETNGITLCEKCHKNFHSLYGYGNNTVEQFKEWIDLDNLSICEYNGKIQESRMAFLIESETIIPNIVNYCKENNLDHSCIYDCCNKQLKSYKGKHYIWYDEYIKMTEYDIENFLNWCNTDKKCTKVICITTNEIFNTISSAKNKYKAWKISDCLNKKRKYSGKLDNGTELEWMSYDDYLNLTT